MHSWRCVRKTARCAVRGTTDRRLLPLCATQRATAHVGGMQVWVPWQKKGGGAQGRRRKGASCSRHALATQPLRPAKLAPLEVHAAHRANLLACATQHGTSCGVQVCEGVGSRGVAGAGCDGAARVADAVSAAPPSGKCGGGAWHGCGQRTRERRWRREGAPSAPYGWAFLYFFT